MNMGPDFGVETKQRVEISLKPRLRQKPLRLIVAKPLVASLSLPLDGSSATCDSSKTHNNKEDRVSLGHSSSFPDRPASLKIASLVGDRDWSRAIAVRGPVSTLSISILVLWISRA